MSNFLLFLTMAFFVASMVFVKKRFTNSVLKMGSLILLSFSIMYWWRLNVSIESKFYEEGCFFEFDQGKRGGVNVLHKGQIQHYQLNTPNDFLFDEAYEGDCFIVEYYMFTGLRYLYSIKLIMDD
ncbi:hypothetical protein [Amphritea balenae]|uniref:Uncharacterized protein n=1 Tax=Amphritea balenae TaxID=452629 RepID=A0A3P1SHR5_9GAMM|nr:hypothetical protein [Amphritea balenae]RRC96821.1 hypothetical protein EHS89_19890 [Amphritea balenae]GGK61467.1 hypothetical protein GCM10007941_09580 [Amphritea balenae]